MQTFAAPGYMACPGNRKDVPRPILGAPGGLAGLGLAPSPSRAGPRVGAICLWHPPPPVPPGFLGQAPGLMRPSPPANPLREAVFPAVGSSVVIPVFLGYQHPQLRFLHLHAVPLILHMKILTRKRSALVNCELSCRRKPKTHKRSESRGHAALQLGIENLPQVGCSCTSSKLAVGGEA